MRDIHQFATSLTYGDAISDEMLEIRSVLREKGHRSEIFTRFVDPKMSSLSRDYREYKKFSSTGNVVIFHFSIGSPVSKLVLRIPDKKIMIYHNITPHEFFVDSHRILARECYKGRLEIKLFVGKTDLALGDSEFNRRELEASGYSRTGVLPILMNFSKFNVAGQPITRKIFDNGKKTLLFIGRVIPNKKFEDCIKVFHFYQKYFNPDSQLILAGDYRGMERYHAGLRALIDELRTDDIHLTGHLPFEDLLATYEVADLYLSMSEHEGFGVPLLEAFQRKIPVVAYDAAAVGETMNGGGILIKKKNFFQTAAVIDAVLRDENLRRTVIASQFKALEKYRRENVSRVLMNHIERVALG